MEFDLKEVLIVDNIKWVVEKFNFLNEDDMYVVIGYNGLIVV